MKIPKLQLGLTSEYGAFNGNIAYAEGKPDRRKPSHRRSNSKSRSRHRSGGRGRE